MEPEQVAGLVEAMAELQLAAFLAGRGSVKSMKHGTRTAAPAPSMDDFRRMASAAIEAKDSPEGAPYGEGLIGRIDTLEAHNALLRRMTAYAQGEQIRLMAWRTKALEKAAHLSNKWGQEASANGSEYNRGRDDGAAAILSVLERLDDDIREQSNGA